MYKKEDIAQYLPDEQTNKFILENWDLFKKCYDVKNGPLDILGGRNLQTFWNESNADYAVITEPSDPNDPVQQYSSSISRDKADVFIANLTNQLMVPSCIAQNSAQEIDRIVSKVAKGMLFFMHMNDGYPSESGNLKNTRLVHKMVVEGTVHVQDNVNKDGLDSEMVPNEELFIPNFWQPDIQKQSVVFRAKLNVTYEDLEAIFGDRPNWKYVDKCFSEAFYTLRPEFKNQWQGILNYESMQALYVWKKMTKKELKEQKAKGRVSPKARQHRWFNVLINNIPMFDLDTISQYRDGFCPINKGVFARFAKSEFYWGNSLPNKIHEDKKWKDAWKTLLRYKAKLNLGKPMISKNGQFIDEEIILPFKITPVPDGTELEVIEGVADPISTADVQMMKLGDEEIDRGSRAPQTEIDPDQTARASVITESNAQLLLDTFAREVAFLQCARSYALVMRGFQFFPRRDIKKICIPEQSLPDGRVGVLEVIFDSQPDTEMTEEELLDKSLEIRKEERASVDSKNPKEKVYVGIQYLDEIDMYIQPDVAKSVFNKSEVMKAQFNRNAATYLGNPDIFNRRKVARRLVQVNEDDEDLLNEEGQMPVTPQQQMAMAGAGGQQADRGEMSPLKPLGKLPNI